MVLLIPVSNGIIGLATVFIACEIGHRMNDAFKEINFTIDKLDWHLFPIEIKRMFPMIIAIVQQPVTLECFGSIACTRDVFKNVGIDQSTIQVNFRNYRASFISFPGDSSSIFIFYVASSTWRLKAWDN